MLLVASRDWGVECAVLDTENDSSGASESGGESKSCGRWVVGVEIVGRSLDFVGDVTRGTGDNNPSNSCSVILLFSSIAFFLVTFFIDSLHTKLVANSA